MNGAALNRRLIGRYGAPFTLRRETNAPGPNAWTSAAQVPGYHALRGRARYYKPEEIKGAILEKDMLIVVDPASVTVAPAKGDRVARGAVTADAGAEWLHVVNVYAPREGDEIAAYRLQVRA